MRFATLFVLLCATSATAQEIDRLQAAKDFGFEGLKLSTSVVEFQRMFPSAQINDSGCDKSVGVTEYATQGKGAPSHGTAFATFCDGKLYQIQIFYTHEQLMKIGGYGVPFTKLADKLGRSSEPVEELEKGSRLTWPFPEINRRISCAGIVGVGCDITVIDTQIEAEVQRRKTKSADLGF